MPNVVLRTAAGTPDYSGGNYSSTVVNTPTPSAVVSSGGGASTNSNNSGLTGNTKTTGTQLPGDPGFTPPPTSVNNPDAGYSQAESDITPEATPTEDDFFSKLYEQFAPVIQSINDTETSAETAAYAAGSQEETDLNASLGTRGLGGSSDAAGERATANLGIAQNIATAKQAQSTALSNAYQYLTGQAHTEFTDALASNTALSKDYVANAKATANATIAGVAESGITSASDWQAKDPKGYMAALQYYNGDATALNSALVMAQPQNKIVQSWTSGSTYYQLVTDPITGKPVVQSTDLGVQLPPNYTSTKVGTNSIFFQDSNNPNNTLSITTDPLGTGSLFSGTGQGAALAAQYAQQTGGTDTDSSSSAASSTSSANYITTATTTAGIADPTQTFNTAINGDGTAANPGVGIGTLVSGVIAAEGSSPPRVVNNPGNVKYVAGMAGATDSGVKASDGGTFASFYSPEDGQAAIASTLTNIANGLGANASVQDVLDKYANLSNTPPASATGTQGAVGTNGVPMSQYGALANVAGFDPGTPGASSQSTSQLIDQGAFNYLQTFLSTGTPPSSSGGMGGLSSKVYQSDIQARAEKLYQEATGKPLPNSEELTANLGFINNNNALLTSLSNQEGTIQANSDLLQANITADNINQNAPAINSVIDNFQNFWEGNPGVASYLAQNSTLGNELGSLLALKNASGTTVHDKLISADLLSPDASAKQESQVVNTLMQEAQNGRAAITLTNAKLYQSTDPLGIDSLNPVNDPETFASNVGIDLDAVIAANPGMTPQQVIQSYIENH